MGKTNYYTIEKEINGVNYVAQFNGLSSALRAVDQSYIEGSSNTSVEALAKYIFANVIVEPKGLDIDDFESMEEFNAVVTFGREVMQGKFRDKATNKAAAEK